MNSIILDQFFGQHVSKFDKFWSNKIQQDTTKYNKNQQYTTRYNKIQQGTTKYNKIQQKPTKYNNKAGKKYQFPLEKLMKSALLIEK